MKIQDFYYSALFGIGFFSAIKGLLGGSKAGGKAAGVQSAATEEAISEQRRQFDITRADFKPYRQTGADALPRLKSLISDPTAQLDFIQDNPFFKALTKKSTDVLLNNQAAKGKVGSGETAEALQNSLLLLGNNLLQQQIGNEQSLVNIGQNAVAQTGAFGANTTNNITDLMTQGANARASGIVGDANADRSSLSNLVQTGVNLFGIAKLSDIRFKENIEKIGETNKGLNIYKYNYKGDNKLEIGVMAHEVEEVTPDAVINRNGIKYVDYSKVN